MNILKRAIKAITAPVKGHQETRDILEGIAKRLGERVRVVPYVSELEPQYLFEIRQGSALPILGGRTLLKAGYSNRVYTIYPYDSDAYRHASAYVAEHGLQGKIHVADMKKAA